MLKRIMLSVVSVLFIGLFLSGCDQKVKQQGQPNGHTQVVQGNVGSTINIGIPDLNNIKNIKYPDVVAEVRDSKITGLQLTREVAIQQNAFVNNIKKPQDTSFYEKIALGLLVKNALIDNEIKRQGFTVSVEEAKSYLEQQKKSMDLLPDSDPAKVAYTKTIKDNGFSNASDYIKYMKYTHTCICIHPCICKWRKKAVFCVIPSI